MVGGVAGGWRSWEWVSSSVVEPDYIAGAGEKAPAPGCCCVAQSQMFFGGKVATILKIFNHILTIYTQIERKNRYTSRKAKLYIFLKRIGIYNLNCYTVVQSRKFFCFVPVFYTLKYVKICVCYMSCPLCLHLFFLFFFDFTSLPITSQNAFSCVKMQKHSCLPSSGVVYVWWVMGWGTAHCPAPIQPLNGMKSQCVCVVVGGGHSWAHFRQFR